MKSVCSVQPYTEPTLKFPCLMISDSNNIYLVSKKMGTMYGMIIYHHINGSLNEVGDYYADLRCVNLKPYYGSVTLSSDD
jgi:hypothetical protein